MESQNQDLRISSRRGQRRVSLAAVAALLAVLTVLCSSSLAQAAPGAPGAEQEYDEPPLEMAPTTVEKIRDRMAPQVQPAPHSIPANLRGKIVFKSDLPSEYSEFTWFALDPATGDLWELSESWPHECAEQREAFSANRQYHAFLAGEWMEVGGVLMGGLDGDKTACRLMDEKFVDSTGVQDLYFEASSLLDALVTAAAAGETQPDAWIDDPGFALTQGNIGERELDMWGCKLYRGK